MVRGTHPALAAVRRALARLQTIADPIALRVRALEDLQTLFEPAMSRA